MLLLRRIGGFAFSSVGVGVAVLASNPTWMRSLYFRFVVPSQPAYVRRVGSEYHYYYLEPQFGAYVTSGMIVGVVIGVGIAVMGLWLALKPEKRAQLEAGSGKVS